MLRSRFIDNCFLGKHYLLIVIIVLVLFFLVSCSKSTQVADSELSVELLRIEDKLHFYPQNVESAIDSLNTCLSSSLKEKHQGQLAYLNGLLAYEKGEIDSSLTYIETSLLYFVKQEDKSGQAKCQLLLGWIAETSNYWEQAKTNYYEAIKLMNNTPCETNGWAYMGLFRCKSNLKEVAGEELQKGKEILFETEKIENKLYVEYLDCISKLSEAGTPERLKIIAHKYVQLGLNNKVGGIYKSLAKLFHYSNQKDSASFYIDKSLQHLNNNFPGASLIPASNQFKGLVYFYDKDYANAQLYFNKALKLYDQYGQKGHKYHALKFLHRIDTVNGDYKAAYNHISEENLNYNETRKREKQRMAKVAETTLHVGFLKEELAKTKYTKQINSLMFSCVVLFILMTSVFAYFRYRIKQRELKEKQRIMTSLLTGLGEKRHMLKRLGLEENDSNSLPVQSIEATDDFDQCFTETILYFQKKFDVLSPSEVRYAVMIGMGIPNSTIAEINSVQAPSIRKVKQRIRNKICLDTDCNLQQYFSQYVA